MACFDLTPDKDGGVLKEILTPGVGDESPSAGNLVTVHYVGTLEDGSQFDSSRDRGDMFEFTLGKGEVIKAWDLGVKSMKKGEVCRLTCKSKYAYGASGSPPKIPPNATLFFEVELFSWKDEDLSEAKDGGITRVLVKEGSGFDNPTDGALVDIHIKGTAGDKVFDERDVKFNLGEGLDVNIPVGLETALQKFKKDEESIIKLTSKYAFGSEGNSDLNVSPGESLKYEVTLKSFEKVKQAWEMNPKEKIDQAKIYKEKGTKYFKEGKFVLAEKQYREMTSLVDSNPGVVDEEGAENDALVLAGHLNLAACHLKLRNYGEVKVHTEKALEKDEKSVKALFRRAQAFQALGDCEEAIELYQKCISLDSTNSSAKKQLQICKDQLKAEKQKAKQIYAGMFEKFAKSDIKKTQARKGAFLKDGVGEWDEEEKKKKEAEEMLSGVKLLSTGDDIKGDELNMASS